MSNKPNLYSRDQSPLYRLRSKRKLARLLGITVKRLWELAKTNHLYSQFTIEKKSGGVRAIDNPHEGLKKLQRRLAVLSGRILPPGYLFCPVKGRSYVTNAAAHRNGRVLHSLDVKD